ncbi:MAG: hypothetical protein M1376_21345 [Planctomycetes bacterium]|nr:hypothetical protein [Planctomycetota bacterium]
MSTREFILTWIVLAILSGASCRRAETFSSQKGTVMAAKTIEQVQQEHTEAWMAIPGVIGTAIGQCEDRPCILILTAANTEQVRREIPPKVDGYPVVVQYTGEIHAR